MSNTYCSSRSASLRRASVEVRVGTVGVGGRNPIRIQSMTTSDTQDVAATVAQSVALAEAGCEIVRVTAPNVQAAACLREIRARFSAAGFAHIPLVADIHFLPTAAMEAVEHVEKIRVNPGNYADKKKFAVRDYSDAAYGLELERLHEAFSPLVRRCRELGRSLRIGTNHGSLSDRIMNRFGDSPLGMVESALEFVRICEDNGFHDIILSMKASNPKVVIQAYRLLVARMDAAHRAYPLHLGVTEAGDGEDGRIKSAIGIGGLLLDGIGDTIRVSLTEDSVHEIPVAQALAAKAMSLWVPAPGAPAGADAIDPFAYTRRPAAEQALGGRIPCGALNPPRVIVPAPSGPALRETLASLRSPKLADTPPEGVLVQVSDASELASLPDFSPALPVLELAPGIAPEALSRPAKALPHGSLLCRRFGPGDAALLASFLRLTRSLGLILAADLSPAACRGLSETLQALGSEGLVITLSDFRRDAVPGPASHALGAYRELAECLRNCKCSAPLWIRSTRENSIAPAPGLLSLLLEASILGGGLLADGLGDLLSIETEPDALRSLRLCYNVLQGAGSRISKTEYVACPSCGRTLFDLQSTTRRIREKTGHLKGVKLAIMGCIVNGPGEMADADFGYVGGAPGKINLYVGKDCVQYNLPAEEADARLISLIKEHGRWQEPPPPSS
jgi:(E)-4-hydroxy-3-methylbut-2-enyl-diphosphate synthase